MPAGPILASGVQTFCRALGLKYGVLDGNLPTGIILDIAIIEESSIPAFPKQEVTIRRQRIGNIVVGQERQALDGLTSFKACDPFYEAHQHLQLWLCVAQICQDVRRRERSWAERVARP